MRVVEARPVPLLSPGLVKMEERKRPAPHEHADSAPPLKKQATSVNGGGKSHPDAEMPWKDELEVSLVSLRNRPDITTLLSPSPCNHSSSLHTLTTPSWIYSAFRKMRFGVRCKSINGRGTL